MVIALEQSGDGGLVDLHFGSADTYGSVDFDRSQGLHSIPARFGIEKSLLVSRVFHVIAVMSLATIALVLPVDLLYLVGVTAVGFLLAYEQSMVKSDDLSKVKQAFDLNGWVGIVYLITTAASLYGN